MSDGRDLNSSSQSEESLKFLHLMLTENPHREGWDLTMYILEYVWRLLARKPQAADKCIPEYDRVSIKQILIVLICTFILQLHNIESLHAYIYRVNIYIIYTNDEHKFERLQTQGVLEFQICVNHRLE